MGASGEVEIGATFAGRYEIRKLLGDGGMGKVLLAADQMLGGELVAIKLLHGDLSNHPKQSQRFLRELQITRRLTHPNIVRTYDFGRAGDQLFITMEYVEGTTLKDKLNVAKLSAHEVVDVLIQLCQGLILIHAEGVIHRDIKPGNVIVTPEGVAKLADFGIARTGLSDLTNHNELVGSAAYLAPEAWAGKPVDGRADIYSLGIMAYELLTGVLPFDAESAPEMMCLHLEASPEPIVTAAPRTPAWLVKVIERCLAKEPEKRFQNCEDLLQALDAGMHGKSIDLESTTPKPVSSIHPTPPPESLIDEALSLESGEVSTVIRRSKEKAKSSGLVCASARLALQKFRGSDEVNLSAPQSTVAERPKAQTASWVALQLRGILLTVVAALALHYFGATVIKPLRLGLTGETPLVEHCGILALSLGVQSFLGSLPILWIALSRVSVAQAALAWLRLGVATSILGAILLSANVLRIDTLAQVLGPQKKESQVAWIARARSGSSIVLPPTLDNLLQAELLSPIGTDYRAAVQFNSPALAPSDKPTLLGRASYYTCMLCFLAALSLSLWCMPTSAQPSVKKLFFRAFAWVGASTAVGLLVLPLLTEILPRKFQFPIDLEIAGSMLNLSIPALGWATLSWLGLAWILRKI